MSVAVIARGNEFQSLIALYIEKFVDLRPIDKLE